MTTKTLSAVEKLDNAYIEDASETVSDSQQEFVVREFDPKFMKKTMLKSLGMMKDLGHDPKGKTYALLSSLYYVTYAPFMVPFALLGKRTRMVSVLTLCALLWGVAATCFAGVQNYSGAFACRLFIGLGEAGFGPLIQVFLSRFYPREKLGIRVGVWLAMAPLGGFINGIVAYGVSFIHVKLESWRILFMIEGGFTVLLAITAIIVLPDDIKSCKWFTAEEKDYLMYERYMSMGPEVKEINWKHARGAFYRWPQVMPVLINMCQQITGAALSAYLPTLLQENGFKGATAQIATLAPYGAAAVCMIIAAKASDRFGNRGWPTQFGWLLLIVGFAIFLGAHESNKPAHFVALILAEVGHYICTPLIVTWSANNAGSESRRAVAVPLAVACAQAVAIGSGYLFPAEDGPRYTKGASVEVALSTAGMIFTFIYMALIKLENSRRDKREGGSPAPGTRPDTAQYADEAEGFRYIG
ncbi:MFS general substrate transporter [Aureobasidium namibiae CBS 147.97]|uniref:MFS general substrate transporter n=1 Tax=Aureobasidium namibiae CBS 147.97 TaxID=1043004 RepID=A0A074WSJ0_9PEZI|nr:MFS general substrate transporter [Aureobasidium namibiae CBS 147.97]KEQ72722.1 MFS general substrate transporter [Aureobasidium namibiae CBS 147.97]